jgi:hypothetical protein
MKKYAKAPRRNVVGDISNNCCMIVNESDVAFQVQFADGIKAFRAKSEVKIYKRTPKYVKQIFIGGSL